jgi:hypothetical protein
LHSLFKGQSSDIEIKEQIHDFFGWSFDTEGDHMSSGVFRCLKIARRHIELRELKALDPWMHAMGVATLRNAYCDACLPRAPGKPLQGLYRNISHAGESHTGQYGTKAVEDFSAFTFIDSGRFHGSLIPDSRTFILCAFQRSSALMDKNVAVHQHCFLMASNKEI